MEIRQQNNQIVSFRQTKGTMVITDTNTHFWLKFIRRKQLEG